MRPDQDQRLDAFIAAAKRQYEHNRVEDMEAEQKRVIDLFVHELGQELVDLLDIHSKVAWENDQALASITFRVYDVGYKIRLSHIDEWSIWTRRLTDKEPTCVQYPFGDLRIRLLLLIDTFLSSPSVSPNVNVYERTGT